MTPSENTLYNQPLEYTLTTTTKPLYRDKSTLETTYQTKDKTLSFTLTEFDEFFLQRLASYFVPDGEDELYAYQNFKQKWIQARFEAMDEWPHESNLRWQFP